MAAGRSNERLGRFQTKVNSLYGCRTRSSGHRTPNRGNLGGMPVDLGKKVLKLKTSVALPEDVQQEAREVALAHGISLSDYLVRLLRADLEARKSEQKEGGS